MFHNMLLSGVHGLYDHLHFKSPWSKTVSFFLKFKKFCFVYFWLCWVFAAAVGFLSLLQRESPDYSLVAVEDFSSRWLLSLLSTSSRHAGFSSCGIWAKLLHSMWYLPVSPALAGGFFSTKLPGKSHKDSLTSHCNQFCVMIFLYT